MADERHDAAFIVGAVVGGVAGAAFALFRAPQAGAQTRAQLAERRDAVSNRLAAGIAALDERARRLVARVGGAVAPVGARLEAIRPAPPPSEDVAGGGEPVFLLPDPLEPDPIVDPDPIGRDAAGVATPPVAADGLPRVLQDRVVSVPEVPHVDVVIEGPRPSSAE